MSKTYGFETLSIHAGASPDPTTGARISSPDCTVTLPVGAPSFSRSNLYNDLAFYGQDTWRVSSRLTLDFSIPYPSTTLCTARR